MKIIHLYGRTIRVKVRTGRIIVNHQRVAGYFEPRRWLLTVARDQRDVALVHLGMHLERGIHTTDPLVILGAR